MALRPAAGVVVDTTIRPGHVDFTRYTTPGRCLQAVQALHDPWRPRLDNEPYDPVHQAPAPDVAALARSWCGQSFAVAGSPRDELPNLIELALIAGDDATAKAAADRWLALKAGDTAMTRRGWYALDVFKAYMAARPMRLAAAEAVLAKIDSLGDAALEARRIGHSLLVTYAEQAFDTTRLEHEERTFLALTPPQVNIVPKALFWLDWEGYPDQSNIGGSALINLYVLSAYRGALSPQELRDEWAKQLAELQKAGVTVDSPTVSIMKAAGAVMSQPAPPAKATFWFGDRGAHVWPTPGKISLMIDASGWPGHPERYADAAMVRRLAEKYGDKLVVTLFTGTQGYRNDGPMEPAAEAEWLRKYFVEFLKLPVNVAVDQTPVTKLPDGRLQPGAPPYQTNYQFPGWFGPGMPPMCLTDETGRPVLFIFGNEHALDAIIGRLLGRHAGK